MSRRWTRPHGDGRERGGSRAGNAALEFALTFLLLWLLITGTFRIGYSMYVYQSLVNALAGAGRYAARVDFDSPDHAFVAKIKSMAVYGSATGGSQPLAPGLATSNIQVTWTLDDKGLPTTLTIAVVSYSLDALFQSFTWSGKPSVTVRFAGRYTS